MPEPLSAATLRIEPWERAALIDVASRLRAGSLRLDMRRVSDIGAGRCLGAHVAASPGAPPAVAARPFFYVFALCGVARSPALWPLFAPGATRQSGSLGHPGWGAKAAEGARAIEGFLAGAGARCWDFMIGEAADG